MDFMMEMTVGFKDLRKEVKDLTRNFDQYKR